MAKPAAPETSFAPYPLPDVILPCSDGTTLNAASFRGQWSVIFIYPADDTETCTKEACAFSEAAADFVGRQVSLYGLSPNSLKDHDKFIHKYGLAMPLLSDEGAVAITALGSWVEKSMYGRQYMGTDRSTLIIDPEGMIRRVWRKVRVKNHVADVLQALDALTS